MPFQNSYSSTHQGRFSKIPKHERACDGGHFGRKERRERTLFTHGDGRSSEAAASKERKKTGISDAQVMLPWYAWPLMNGSTSIQGGIYVESCPHKFESTQRKTPMYHPFHERFTAPRTRLGGMWAWVGTRCPPLLWKISNGTFEYDSPFVPYASGLGSRNVCCSLDR